MPGMLLLRSAKLLATWLIISQSERKIKPHREDRLSGPESVQKHVRSIEELRNKNLISLTVTLKYASSTKVALDLAFPRTFRAIALKSNRLPARDFDKFLSHSTFDSLRKLWYTNHPCDRLELQ